MKIYLIIGTLLSVAAFPAGKRAAQQPGLAAEAGARPVVAESYGKVPLAFEPNLGQTDARVRFLARGGGMTAFFTDTETVMVLRRGERRKAGKAEQAVVRMKLVHGHAARQVQGLEKLPGISNYFIGKQPAKWRTNVPHYARMQYEGVYPGIDLVWYGNQRQLEYDFVVAPGADPKQIQVAYQGVESLGVEANGALVLRTALGEVRQQQPRVYQEIGGKRVEVGARYAVGASNRVSFELTQYDRKRELRIDPVVLIYSTYLGGTGSDVGNGIAVDGAGSAYVTGQTTSADFPTQSPYQATFQPADDAFVTKLTPAGDALVYSTYLGGSGDGWGSGIAVDAAGSAYVTGYTTAADFPTQSPYQATLQGVQDAFVTELSPAGDALVYSTYLGGSGQDWGQAIALDGAGSAYVTGITQSADFPTQSPYQAAFQGVEDAFVTKLTPAGTALVYSTYLGGSGDDVSLGIAVDGAGSAYVTGSTESIDFPTQSPYQAANHGLLDAFVAKLTPAGTALVYSTYLGGSSTDFGQGIAVDGAGSAYVTGQTTSGDFPTQLPLQATGGAFVAKLTPAGDSLVYSTHLGGSGYDAGQGIAVDGAGSAYVTGITNSTDFPTQSPYQSAFQGGNYDVFVTKLTPAGDAPVYSTYLGGTGDEGGYGIAVDGVGSAYVTGITQSADFPTQSLYQGGTSDAFVTKLRVPGVLTAPILIAPADSATDVSLAPTLSWNVSVEATSYDVYFGTATPPRFVTNTTGTSYGPEPLSASTTYYWQVVAKDSVGGSASSATWSFTTSSAPQVPQLLAPGLVFPADGGTGVITTSVLIWNASSGAASYDIYLGTENPPPLVMNTAATIYSPATLTVGTTYYWRVVAKDSAGSASSATWSFTTLVSPPAVPVLVSPANGATGVPGAPTLVWDASSLATSYDVYFGTQPAPPLVTKMGGSSYLPGTLTQGTTYYWKVVARNDFAAAGSAMWSFTTGGVQAPGPRITLDSIGNAANHVTGQVAPGEMVEVRGLAFGPAAMAQLQYVNGVATTTLGNTRIYFDNVPAPMVYAVSGSPSVLSCVVPYSVAGKTSTQVQVEYNGARGNTVSVPVVAAVPGIFSLNQSGTGPGAILNWPADTLNGVSNRVFAGDNIVAYATGEGKTDIAIDGQQVPLLGPYPMPLLAWTATVGGEPALVASSGGAPGRIAGLFQVNVQIPQDLAPGIYDLVITAGNFSSTAGLTVAVK